MNDSTTLRALLSKDGSKARSTRVEHLELILINLRSWGENDAKLSPAQTSDVAHIIDEYRTILMRQDPRHDI